MSRKDEEEFGFFSIRKGERLTYPINSLFRKKVEIITDSYGTIIGATNKDNLAFLRIPEESCDVSFDTLGRFCFRDAINLKKVFLPRTIEIIEEGAFLNDSNLNEIILNDGLLEIGKEAFKNCSSLAILDLPESIDTIGERAFENCYSLKSINIKSKKLKLSIMSFASTGLENIELESVENLPSGLFIGSKVKRVYLSNTIKSIELGVFSNTLNLESIWYNGTIEEFRKINFDPLWNKGMKKSVTLFIKNEEGTWVDAFKTKEKQSNKNSSKEKLKQNNDKFHLALEVLNIKETDLTEENLKKTYREKAKNFHPDKISSLNLDEEFINFASNKFKEYKEAYDYLFQYLRTVQ